MDMVSYGIAMTDLIWCLQGGTTEPWISPYVFTPFKAQR